MKLTFFGATRNVTGSMFLIEHNGLNILVECGLYQGHRKESEELNRKFPFAPSDIDMVFISHAHIDHSGNLPNLVKNGFKGKIYATPATCDLMEIMLKDSGHIHEMDIKYLNKKLIKKGEEPKEPLYTVEDAEKTANYFASVNYYVPVEVDSEMSVTFIEAGHILGSSQILFEMGDKTMLFTGDLGRQHLPIIRDPDRVEDIDILITETTYGNRLHKKIEDSMGELETIINKTVERGGKIIVPAFSVGRTQEILYDIFQLENDNKIPEIPIYVDSPLSSRVTKVFRNHPECYDSDTMAIFNENKNVFNFGKLKFITEVEESKALNSVDESHMIISASGMCEAGRILHHLKNNIANPDNTVIITGFMAANTLGRRIMEKHKQVRIFGEEYDLNADVYVMNEYSAHADKLGLLKHLKEADPERTFLLHGEETQQFAFKDTIEKDGYSNVEVPERGDSFVV